MNLTAGAVGDSDTTSQRAETIALGLLILAALVARLPGLTESLWYDETWSTRVVLGNFGDAIRVGLEDVHPPLYTLIMYAWTRVFGDTELSARAIPLMAGLATIAMMPALGSRLATRNAGWVAAVLLTVSPIHIWYSQEARQYSLIMFMTVVVVLLWHRLKDRSTPGGRVLFVALCAAMAQLHYFAVAVPAALAASALWQRRHVGLALWALGVSTVGVVLLIGVKTVMYGMTTEEVYLGAFTPAAAVQLFFKWFTLGGALRLSPNDPPAANLVGYVLAGIAMLLTGCWLVLGWTRLRRPEFVEHLLLLLAIPGLLLVLYVVGQRHYYIERSALPSLPFFTLAIGAGATLIRRVSVRRFALAATLGGAGLILAVYRGKPDVWTVYKPNPDWRTVTRSGSGFASGERLVVFSTTPLRELVYYLTDAAECSWPPLPPAQQVFHGTAREKLARLFARSVRPTCGAEGNARARLYVNVNPAGNWVDSVRAYEPGARSIVVVNRFWLGETAKLISDLRASGHALQLLSRARGLEVYALD
jgi:hypothetical protein